MYVKELLVTEVIEKRDGPQATCWYQGLPVLGWCRGMGQGLLLYCVRLCSTGRDVCVGLGGQRVVERHDVEGIHHRAHGNQIKVVQRRQPSRR